MFEASHVEIKRWFDEGLVDGLRVDHPDGLRDPGGYLEDLAALTGGAYVLVEKILEPGERLLPTWATAGTTGYDALGLVDRVLTDPAGEEPLTALAERLGARSDWHELIHDTKRAIADDALHSEVRRIVRDLSGPAGESTRPEPASLVDAVAELLACFPVYRSYLPEGRAHLDHGFAAARRRRPDLDAAFDRVAADAARPAQSRGAPLPADQRDGHGQGRGGLRVLPLLPADLAQRGRRRPERLRRIGRGVPRGHGRPPGRVAARDDGAHDPRHQAQRGRPGPDLGAGRDPGRVGGRSRRAARAGAAARSRLRLPALAGGPRMPGPPRGSGCTPTPRRRCARRASAPRGSRPDEDYESAVHAAVDAAFDDPRVEAVLARLCDRIDAAACSNALSAKLLALTMPGVPDVYQGTELWDQSLVDPDNRRPVDFDASCRCARRGRGPGLAQAGSGAVHPGSAARATRPLLVLRAGRSDRTGGGPRPGLRPRRGGRGRHPAAGRPGRAGLAGTTLGLPAGSWTDVLTGRPATGRVEALLDTYPVALLVRTTR